ncbi:rhomboid family protein [Salimicrobium jeotgali]|uniref:rhomboid family protein n=1 Tax=Salimicrobium jeotgali TaxID=1230341 RepID=UPI000C8378A1|nr:rhomboid family intramembrane serine protease [Salimicrobium jeotgali]
MEIEQRYFFWKLAYDLVSRFDFEIIHLHLQREEVWLEKSSGGQSHVIRLLNKEFHWSNHVKADIEHVNRQLEKNKRYFSGRIKNIDLLYVAEHPTVDEFDSPAVKLAHNSNVIFLSDDNKERGLEQLAATNKLDHPPEINYKLPDAPLEYESTIEYMKHQLYSIRQKQQKKMREVFEYGKPRITYLLLIINLIIFYYLESIGSTTSISTLIENGAKYNPGIIEGEWWRLISSMFLHIGVLHLLMNMLALFYLGTAVEQIYGSFRFTMIYFLAGILGSAASFYFNTSVAAGASGAIFGLFGALLYFAWRYPSLFFRTMGWNLIILVAINIVLGITVPQVDNSGHMGGLIGGFLAAQLVDLPNLSHRVYRTLSVALYALGLAVLLAAGSGSDLKLTAADIQYLQELQEEERYEDMLDITESLEKTDGEWEDEYLFFRSYAYLQTGRENLAFDDLRKAVDIAPEFAEAHFNLSILYERRGNEKKAEYHQKKAEELNAELRNKDPERPASS